MVKSMMLVIILGVGSANAANYSVEFKSDFNSCYLVNDDFPEDPGQIINFGLADANGFCDDNPTLHCTSEITFFNIGMAKLAGANATFCESNHGDCLETIFSVPQNSSAFMTVKDNYYKEGIAIRKDQYDFDESTVLDRWRETTQYVNACNYLKIKFRVFKR